MQVTLDIDCLVSDDHCHHNRNIIVSSDDALSIAQDREQKEKKEAMHTGQHCLYEMCTRSMLVVSWDVSVIDDGEINMRKKVNNNKSKGNVIIMQAKKICFFLCFRSPTSFNAHQLPTTTHG